LSNNRPPSSSRGPERRPSTGRAYDQYAVSDDRSSSRKSPSGRAPAPRSASGRGSAERSTASRPASEGRSSRNSNSGARRPSPNQRSGRPPVKKRRRKRSLLPLVLLLTLAALLVIVLKVWVFNGAPTDSGKYTLEFSSQTLVLGSTATAKVVGLPEGDKSPITWSSNDTEIVRVDDGTLTARKLGTATISASVNGKNVSGSVKVIETAEGVKSLTLSQSNVTIVSGQTVQLEHTVSFEDATAPAVSPIWSSSNSAVASVSNDGLVTARDVGSASITATIGNQSAVCVITVSKNPNSEPVTSTEGSEPDTTAPVAPAQGGVSTGNSNTPTSGTNGGKTSASSLTLSQPDYYLSAGGTLVVEAAVSPAGTAITWSSNNSAIASVSGGGLVTGKAAGTAVITAKAGSLTASCKIYVSADDDTSTPPEAPAQ